MIMKIDINIINIIILCGIVIWHWYVIGNYC